MDPVLTDDIIERICNYVRAGVPLRFASEAAGVSYSMARRWSSWGKRGYRDDHPASPMMMARYQRFSEELDIARAQSVAVRIERIQEAADRGFWQADAWWLERQLPEEFGRVNKLVVQSTDSLEMELRELLGPEAAEQMMADAREKIESLREAKEEFALGELAKAPAELESGDA